MLPTNIAGSIGLAQLKKTLQARRKKIYTSIRIYSTNWIENPVNAEDDTLLFYLLQKVPDRDRLANFLLENEYILHFVTTRFI